LGEQPMHREDVEIYSDATNAAVMRHPGRRFPGVLVQGDSLYILCTQADIACQEIGRGTAGYDELNDLRNKLWDFLNHYKATLTEHGIPLPFNDQPLP
jgi:hypothetical protein